jgi:Zn-dependent protease
MVITSFIFIVILIGSVILHEVAHGWTAYKLGDPTAKLQGRITLNPMAHIDWVGSVILPALLVFSGAPFVFGWAKPVPFNPYNLKNPKWGGALVAAMGPITNILIAIIAALLFNVVGGSSAILDYILQGSIITNIVLAVFNLVPIPPLDGHHILFALLPDSLSGFKQSLQRAAWPLVIIFVIFGWRYISPVIMSIYNLLV